MKKNLFSNVILFCLTSLSLLKAQAPVPDLFHYKFDNVGTTVTNYATNPPLGTATGTIVGGQTQTGAINCMNALVGTGVTSSSDFVNTGWATSMPSNWTISFWTSNIQPNSTLYYIFGDNTAGGLRCFTNGVAGPNNWILRGGFTDILITGAATPSANMVTFVYDQSTNSSFGYINGVQTVSVAQTGTPSIVGTGPFKVGAYSANTGLSPAGLLADFRIYGSALTASQVAAIYAATSPSIGTLSISGPTAICNGQNAVLTGSGTVNTYTWSTGASTNSISVTPTATTIYTVSGGISTCSAQSTYTLNVNALPNVSVTNATTCAGQATTLTATGANTYSWSTNATTPSISVAPTTNTSYIVTGTSTNNCVKSATASVLVNVNPIISVAGASSVCANSSVALIASGANTYSWNTSATTASISVTPSANITYTVVGTTTAGCSSSAIKSLTVAASPTISVAGASVLCSGASATLTASGANTYSWNTNATTASISVTPTTNISYTVVGTNTAGCSSSAIKSLTVSVNPSVSISGTSSLCAGSSVGLTANGANTYSWNTNATTASISVSPTANITYTVVGTNSAGCSSSAITSLTVNALPAIGVTTSNTLICVGQSASLTTSGASTYSITGGSFAISPTVTTTYTVTGTSAAGCVGSTAFTQSVSTCTGINNLASISSANMMLYPNPTNGVLTIKSDLINGTIEFVNALGQTVVSENITRETQTINISSLTNGIYFVKLIENGKVVDVKKVVKQ